MALSPEILAALTGASTRSYFDPELWVRLLPLIQERQVELAANLLDGRFSTMEAAKDIIGEARGLRWVMDAAAELTRTPDGKD